MTTVEPREDPPTEASELETLLGFLDYQRGTIALKTDGMDDVQLRTPLPPSTMTLGGLLKHLAFVEDFWIGMTVRGRPPAEPFSSAPWDDDPDWEWRSSAWETADELRGLWGGAVEASHSELDEVLADLGDAGLGTRFPRWESEESVSLRWVLIHLIEEYSRQAGHADLLAEHVDGRRGE